MGYETFRSVWHEALDLAGLKPFFRPSEAVDLQEMSRSYRMGVALDARRTDLFTVSAELEWKWDALQAARMATTEEDLLTELLGQDGYYLVTEQPWLRVDVKLRATLPMDSPIPMPGAGVWQRWTREVTQRMSPLLPAELPDVHEDSGAVLLFWRGNPVARLQCDPDGRLYLTGVELSAWQGIELSRHWDNPDRPRDYGTEAQLTSFCEWVRESLQVWRDCLRHFVAG